MPIWRYTVYVLNTTVASWDYYYYYCSTCILFTCGIQRRSIANICKHVRRHARLDFQGCSQISRFRHFLVCGKVDFEPIPCGLGALQSLSRQLHWRTSMDFSLDMKWLKKIKPNMIWSIYHGIWISNERHWTLRNKCLAQDMARVDLSHFASSFWSGAEGQDTKRDSCVAMMTVMQDACLETRCPAPTPSRLCYHRKSKRESLSVPLRLLWPSYVRATAALEFHNVSVQKWFNECSECLFSFTWTAITIGTRPNVEKVPTVFQQLHVRFRSLAALQYCYLSIS